jgi:hypothetical protein
MSIFFLIFKLAMHMGSCIKVVKPKNLVSYPYRAEIEPSGT